MLRDNFKGHRSILTNWGTISYLTVASIQDANALSVWVLMQATPSSALCLEAIKSNLKMSQKNLDKALAKLKEIGLIEHKELFENGVQTINEIKVNHTAPVDYLARFLDGEQ